MPLHTIVSGRVLFPGMLVGPLPRLVGSSSPVSGLVFRLRQWNFTLGEVDAPPQFRVNGSPQVWLGPLLYKRAAGNAAREAPARLPSHGKSEEGKQIRNDHNKKIARGAKRRPLALRVASDFFIMIISYLFSLFRFSGITLVCAGTPPKNAPILQFGGGSPFLLFCFSSLCCRKKVARKRRAPPAGRSFSCRNCPPAGKIQCTQFRFSLFSLFFSLFSLFSLF